MEETRTSHVDRRHRNRVLKGATIITGVATSEITCAVRNMNTDGAELRVSGYAVIPESFILYVPVDNVAYNCDLRWRAGERAGVRFNATVPKPSGHYG